MSAQVYNDVLLIIVVPFFKVFGLDIFVPKLLIMFFIQIGKSLVEAVSNVLKANKTVLSESEITNRTGTRYGLFQEKISVLGVVGYIIFQCFTHGHYDFSPPRHVFCPWTSIKLTPWT